MGMTEKEFGEVLQVVARKVVLLLNEVFPDGFKMAMAVDAEGYTGMSSNVKPGAAEGMLYDYLVELYKQDGDQQDGDQLDLLFQ